MDTPPTILRPPRLPAGDPTINVSHSQLAAFAACPQRWYWNYCRRITPRRLFVAPTLGSAVHTGLAAHLKGKNLFEAMRNWHVVEEAKNCTIENTEDGISWSIGPELDDIYAKAWRILEGYIESGCAPDPASVVYCEQPFEVPIRGTSVRFFGVVDAVIRHNDGTLWLFEHKVVKRFRTPEEHQFDVQTGLYTAALKRLGIRVVGSIVNQLLASTPSIPKLNKDGSMSRSTIKTTWEIYAGALHESGLDPTDYEDMKDKLKDNTFLRRDALYRSETEINFWRDEIGRRTWELLRARRGASHVYMSPGIQCMACRYRELCIESLRGGNIEDLISAEYVPVTPRPIEQIKEEEEEKSNDNQ
jgi:hypothetical protein